MRKYCFILEMQNGKTFCVQAFTQHEAEVLCEAYCILTSQTYDLDVVTCEEQGKATRHHTDPHQFEREWNEAEPVDFRG